MTRHATGRLVRWAALYLAVGMVVALIEPEGGEAAFYPPIAIGIAILGEFGPTLLPMVLACDIAVSVVQYDLAVPPALVSGVVTALDAWFIAAVLRRLGFRRTMERVEDVAMLGGTAALGALAAATIGTALQRAVGYGGHDAWRVWVLGDLSGAAIVLPAVLVLTGRRGSLRRSLSAAVNRIEFAAVTVVALALVAGYFLTINPGDVDVDSAGPLLLCLLPVFWYAVRFGFARTALFLVVVDLTAGLAYSGLGPHVFVRKAGSQSWDLAVVQLPMLALSLAALGVAAALAGQQNARTRENATFLSSPLAIVSIDDQAHVNSWNPAAERIFGYQAAEAIGRIPPMIPPDGRDEFRRRFAREVAEPLQQRIVYRRKDGTPVTTRLFTSPLRDADGVNTGVMAVIEDVTEMARLEEQQALLNAAIDQAGDSIVVTDPTPAIIYANPAAARTSGYALEEVLGQNPRMFKSGLHDARYYEQMWGTISSGGTWTGVMVNKRKSGELFEEQVSIRPVKDVEGHIVAYVAVKHDLTAQKALEAAAARDRDELSRNREARAAVIEVMNRVRPQETKEATATQLCAAMVDSTDFDIAVVMLLHPDGSLEPMGQAGPMMSARADTMLTPLNGANEVVALTERRTWSIETANLSAASGWRDRAFTSGITAMVFAPLRWEGEMFGVLVTATRASDAALWVHSREHLVDEIGSFAGVLIGAQLDRERPAERIRAHIEAVIAEQRFTPVFQPWVDLTTGEVRGFEALTRFHDGIRPDRKIRDAWIVGLGPQLEAACARAALDVADEILRDLPISVNFSPATILDGTAAEVIRGRTRPVVIEVTEHTAIEDYDALRTALRSCGDGVKVSIDDAGAGFSSLRHILELQPDVVKLDIGLIQGIDADRARQALAAGLVHYAADTRTVLIAEGVETEAEAETVRRLGVHYGQGYHFGRPSPTGSSSSPA